MHGIAVALLGVLATTDLDAAPGRFGITLRARVVVSDSRESSLGLFLDGPLAPPTRAHRLARAGHSPPIARGAPLAESGTTDGSQVPEGTDGFQPESGVPLTPAPAPDLPPPVPLLAPALVRDTVAAARRAAATQRVRERLATLARRARRAAALPELQVRGGRTTDESLKLNPTEDDPYRFTQSGGTKTVGELRLRWRLDRLLFDPAELRVVTLEQVRARADAELAKRVLTLLFAWHRGRVRAADATLDPEARMDAELDAMEAALTLDVLTAGWFMVRAGSAVR